MNQTANDELEKTADGDPLADRGIAGTAQGSVTDPDEEGDENGTEGDDDDNGDGDEGNDGDGANV